MPASTKFSLIEVDAMRNAVAWAVVVLLGVGLFLYVMLLS